MTKDPFHFNSQTLLLLSAVLCLKQLFHHTNLGCSVVSFHPPCSSSTARLHNHRYAIVSLISHLFKFQIYIVYNSIYLSLRSIQFLISQIQRKKVWIGRYWQSQGYGWIVWLCSGDCTKGVIGEGFKKGRERRGEEEGVRGEGDQVPWSWDYCRVQWFQPFLWE